jgi:predicted transcriptional regulator
MELDELVKELMLIPGVGTEFSGPVKEASRKTAIRSTPPMYKQVIDAMLDAWDDGEDTFPRSWTHVLRNYILNFVSTASKDAWEPHLINDGFCMNPYGGSRNRGRPMRSASKKAQDTRTEFEGVVAPDNKNLMNWLQTYKSASKALQELYTKWDKSKSVSEQLLKTAVNDLEGLLSHPEATEDEDITLDISELIDELNFAASQGTAKSAQDKSADFDKELDFEVDGPVEDVGEEMIKSFHYPDTKTPIEPGDGVRCHRSPDGNPFKATIVEISDDGNYLILKSKGVEYRVTVEDIEPVPSTFKKMYK